MKLLFSKKSLRSESASYSLHYLHHHIKYIFAIVIAVLILVVIAVVITKLPQCLMNSLFKLKDIELVNSFHNFDPLYVFLSRGGGGYGGGGGGSAGGGRGRALIVLTVLSGLHCFCQQEEFSQAAEMLTAFFGLLCTRDNDISDDVEFLFQEWKDIGLVRSQAEIAQ